MKKIESHIIAGKICKGIHKRIGLGVMICIMFSSIFGCGYAGRARQVQEELRSDKEYAAYYFEQVASALEEKDKEGLKGLFSNYALQNAPQLEEQIDELMDFYPGYNEGYEVTSVNTWETSSYSGKQYAINAKYTVTHNGNSFRMKIVVYTQNVVESDKLGIHVIQVITEETKTEEFKWRNEKSEPGIYVLK